MSRTGEIHGLRHYTPGDAFWLVLYTRPDGIVIDLAITTDKISVYHHSNFTAIKVMDGVYESC